MISTIGRALRRRRAGTDRSLWSDPACAAPECITVTSSSFAEGGELPRRYAGPGAGDNVWPDLHWSGVPAAARTVVVWLEDVDAPTRSPLVHTVAVVPPTTTRLPEGELAAGPGVDLVRASFGMRRYHGPGPIPGHGPHTYRFLVLALDTELTASGRRGFGALHRAAGGHVVGRGMTTCSYER